MRAVNLIPSEERRDGSGIPTGRSEGAIFAVLGLLAGLIVLALLYGRADHQVASRRAEVASLQARAQQEQARAGELAPYTSFVQMREQREQAVTALVSSRFDWAQTFHELGRVLPPGQVSLTSVEGTIGATPGASGSSASTASTASTAASAKAGSSASASGGSASSVTSATPPGSIPTFKLAGCAVSQAEVALMLQRLRLIVGVKEVSLQSSTASGASGGAGGGGAGSCPSGAPVFTAQVVFDALPTPSTSGAGAVPASSTSTGAAG
jgi:Tfp pilus assembly protein PilN